ncbi:unnamed protein product [Heligmosomoides polygyrus]|uniref:39S ribosomal protein L55, mitochondrial n=1 Tax=Heligmosomoides polygyrus TaxID=6339 RepID=A0A183FDR8_HELPZ|nr:unnamed protein product [Heligmosomoides polygyrus]
MNPSQSVRGHTALSTCSSGKNKCDFFAFLNFVSLGTVFSSGSRRGNAWRACLGKISRSQYLRHYPVKLIRADGSTIEIRFLEPRAVVQLPVDLNALTEEEKRHRLAARKPKAKKIVQVGLCPFVSNRAEVFKYSAWMHLCHMPLWRPFMR